MRIGIAGPILTEPFSEFLNGDATAAPKGLGGTAVIQLVRGLLARGLEVSVYSLDREVTRPVVLGGPRLRIYYGAYRPRGRMRDFMRVERSAIRDFVSADKPDVVHAHWTYEFALGALAAGRPTLITVRDWAPTILRLRPDAYRIGRLLMSVATMCKGRNFTANSPYIQSLVGKYVRRPIPMIPNALHDSLFSREEKRLNGAQLRVISINSGFGRLKNVKRLLQAFAFIRKKIPRARLALVGQGFQPSGPAHEWANARGLSDGVEYWGPRPHDEVLHMLDDSHLLIHPSLEESFGLTLAEAMARKTPVIGGENSGAVPYVLDYGRAGVLTDVRSPKHIAEAAVRLLRNEKAWRRFSESGHAYARENFALSRVVEQYVEQYHRVLNGQGGGP